MKKTIIALFLIVSAVTSAADTPKFTPEFSKAKLPFSAIASSLEFKGIAVKEDDYTIWGAAPVIDDAGKVHLYVARWPENNVDPAWRKSSEIAHYVSDHPEGPFKFVSVIVKGSGIKDAWDNCAPHNPDIQRIDGKYVLTYIGNTDYRQPPHPLNQQIGMRISDSPYGPWKKVGKTGLILDDSADPEHFSHGRQVVNPTLAKYKGKYFLYYKTTMNVNGNWRTVFAAAVADKLEGPYRHLAHPFSTKNIVIEDASVFVWDGKLCLLTTDNHGHVTGIRGGGALWISDDGKTCDPSLTQVGYDNLWRYYPNYDPKKLTKVYGSQTKIERPKILMIDGKPAYLYGPSGIEMTGQKRTVNYVLKINLPENASPLPKTDGVTAASSISIDAFQMNLEAPIDKWDEAIPLGNGLIGGLLWGVDNEIRLSLDRGDLWDLRPHPSYIDKDFNYKKVVELARSGKASQLNRTHAKSNDYPTKLPGGRLVITLPSDQKAKSFNLNMKTATGTVDLGDNKIECFFSATKDVALIKLPGKSPKFNFIPNQAVKKLGYKPPTIAGEGIESWFIQDASLDFQYVVYARARQLKDATVIAVTITTNKESDDPFNFARTRVDKALNIGYENLFTDHKKWWANFWSRSSV
ncbi:MAG: glycoside hydrolase family protein, partial [Anaerohalosphaera sp.]|nr:glycoside hydrolase family protein [Anaerohalosphaera sp.]